MLIGFTIVAAPLLFAIVNAAVQMNHLSNRSEQLVVHGMQGTRNNQRMFEEIGALERSARLYQIIPNAELLEVYARNNERLESTINELLSMPLDRESQADALALQSHAERLWQELKAAPPNSPRIGELINSYPQMAELASKISNRVSAQIDRELTTLQLAAQLAQQNLFWQTLLLVPMTLAVVAGLHVSVRQAHPRHRPRDQRTGPRHVLPADFHPRAGGLGALGGAIGVAEGPFIGSGAGKESIPETHVA